MSGGGSSTSTSYQIPTNPAIENFITQTIPYLTETQKVAPLYQFSQPQERQIAGLSPLQQFAGAMVPVVASGNPQQQTAYDILGAGGTRTLGGYPPAPSATAQYDNPALTAQANTLAQSNPAAWRQQYPMGEGDPGLRNAFSTTNMPPQAGEIYTNLPVVPGRSNQAMGPGGGYQTEASPGAGYRAK